MVDPAALDVEEDQIARLEVIAIDLHAVTLGHGIGGARQVDFFDVVEGVLDQAAAVEAFARAAAAPAVRGAQHIDGTAEHVAALLRRHRRDRQAWLAGAGAQLGLAADVLVRTRSRRISGLGGEAVG
ncbi:hypothetical protein D3C81_1890970 [compost metagenome]